MEDKILARKVNLVSTRGASGGARLDAAEGAGSCAGAPTLRGAAPWAAGRGDTEEGRGQRDMSAGAGGSWSKPAPGRVAALKFREGCHRPSRGHVGDPSRSATLPASRPTRGFAGRGGPGAALQGTFTPVVCPLQAAAAGGGGGGGGG